MGSQIITELLPPILMRFFFRFFFFSTKWVPAETRIYTYKNIRVYFYVVFMSVFLSAPAETRCVNKRVLTCIDAYSRIFTR
jgi:hypothetical protein